MAGIDSLYASSAYGQTQGREVTKTAEVVGKISDNNATEFQKVFETRFNGFANLSSAEILNKIRATPTINDSSVEAVSLDFSDKVRKEVMGLRQTLATQEFQAQKAATGEANLVELMTTSAKAKNLLNTFVAVRDEAKNAWEKIFTMPL
jgi:flagellar hook-basal body complex protein FliE